MKVLCKHCLNPCKKFGKIDCEDYFKPSVDDLDKERKKLLVSGENPLRLLELQKQIDYFNYGIL